MWIRELGASFAYAWRGILAAVQRERNFRIHLTAVLYVCAAGLLAELEGIWWAALFLCFGLVLFAELINSALERICDAVTKDRHPMIKNAKDMAAGAVLVSAIAATGIAALVFLRAEARETIWQNLRATPFVPIALALSVPLAVLWIRGRRAWKKQDENKEYYFR
ncbi:diacylglycerol kinase family protein [Oscillospiraceae bacterium OttesenSCG-928-G22]|nr:diacylglycerol kinase family protein [Oscillospiraceae bacterium OttesenSCG-928-G22]